MRNDPVVLKLKRVTVTPPPNSCELIRDYVVVSASCRTKEGEDDAQTMRRLRDFALLTARRAVHKAEIVDDHYPDWNVYPDHIGAIIEIKAKFEMHRRGHAEMKEELSAIPDANSKKLSAIPDADPTKSVEAAFGLRGPCNDPQCGEGTREAVAAEIKTVADVRASEKRLELWKLARKRIAQLSAWPSCLEHGKPLDILGVNGATGEVHLVCEPGCGPHLGFKLFAVPEHLKESDVHRCQIAPEIGGTKK